MKILLIIVCLLIAGIIGMNFIEEDLFESYASDLQSLENKVLLIEEAFLDEKDRLQNLGQHKGFLSNDLNEIGIEIQVYQSGVEAINIYYGTQGHMLIYPHVELPEAYDPTNRPWYEGAWENGSYLSFYSLTDESVTSLSVKTKHGVLGGDYHTAKLLKPIITDEWLISDVYFILPAYDLAQWQGENSFNQAIYASILEGLSENVIKVKGQVAVMRKMTNGWTLVKIVN